ncbi:MAG: GLPGLI family protein [Flavobacteriaceae bacterium]|nr:GLPGLI family protein [Flavobacteriaceae bacterium]
MRKFTLVLVCILFTVGAVAQNFQGMAVYESKTNIDMGDFGGREMTEEMKKMIKERMAKAFEKTYELNFDRKGSIYAEQEKLDAPGQGGGWMKMMNFSSGKLYKNVQEGTYADQREVFGKMFLIKDELKTLDWKLGSETKKIGNYTCYKATATKKVSEFDITNMRARKKGKGPRGKEGEKTEGEKNEDEKVEETEKAEGEDTAEEEGNVKVLSEDVEIPKEVTVTAWYTPEVPLNQGPGEYWGLPGLILEVSAGQTTIVCSKIVMNPKEKSEINAPDKGKEVTQKEFDKIVKDKMEEMRERWGRGSGRRGGGGFRMGGK